MAKKMAKGCSCSCSVKESMTTEDKIRELINLINVYKDEEMEDVTTRIDPATAKELVKKLEEIANEVGNICVCN